MNNYRKVFLSSLIIFLSFLGNPVFAKKDPRTGNTPKEPKSITGLSIGDKIPSFELETEAHKIIKSDEYKGKVLLLTVANYCNKDLAGIWTVNSFYRFYKYKDFGFPFIFSRRCVPFYVPNYFVSLSASWTANQVKVPYFLMDWDEQVSERFKGSPDDPHIYVVDRNGIVRYKMVLSTPFTSQDPMNKLIESLLEEN